MAVAPVSRFIRPASLAAAVEAVRSGARPVSGGTDLILHPSQQPIEMVDLTVLPLGGVTQYGGGVRIGATTTLTTVLEHAAVAAIANGVVATMLLEVGSPLLRNRATIGGHLARGRLSDIIPVLLALDATLTWNDGAEHTQQLSAFYAEGRHRNPMVITAVTIPTPRQPSMAAFRKFTRTAFELSILNCACRVDLDDSGRVAAARVVVGETPALGASLPEVEVALTGRPLTFGAIKAAGNVAAEAVPARNDERATAEYRRSLAAVLVRRCLTEISDGLS